MKPRIWCIWTIRAPIGALLRGSCPITPTIAHWLRSHGAALHGYRFDSE